MNLSEMSVHGAYNLLLSGRQTLKFNYGVGVIRLCSLRMKGQMLICIKGKKPTRVYRVVVLAIGTTLVYSENCSAITSRSMSFLAFVF